MGIGIGGENGRPPPFAPPLPLPLSFPLLPPFPPPVLPLGPARVLGRHFRSRRRPKSLYRRLFGPPSEPKALGWAAFQLPCDLDRPSGSLPEPSVGRGSWVLHVPPVFRHPLLHTANGSVLHTLRPSAHPVAAWFHPGVHISLTKRPRPSRAGPSRSKSNQHPSDQATRSRARSPRGSWLMAHATTTGSGGDALSFLVSFPEPNANAQRHPRHLVGATQDPARYNRSKPAVVARPASSPPAPLLLHPPAFLFAPPGPTLPQHNTKRNCHAASGSLGISFTHSNCQVPCPRRLAFSPSAPCPFPLPRAPGVFGASVLRRFSPSVRYIGASGSIGSCRSTESC